MIHSLTVSIRLLKMFYWVIPISLLIVLIDRIFGENQIRFSLPGSPDDLFWFAIFFHLPHIVASSLSFFDRDYLKFYKKKLIFPWLIIFGSLLLLPDWIGRVYFLFLFGLWTILHVVGQQLGITLMIEKGRPIGFSLWKGLSLLVAATTFISEYSRASFLLDYADLLKMSSIILLAPLGMVSFRLIRGLEKADAKKFVGLNYLMVGSTVAMHWLSQTFFMFF